MLISHKDITFRSGTLTLEGVMHIPKGDGRKTRPIGIPTFEDKVLQRAVAMLLEAVYEQDFMDCSYGFRPKRSAHQAYRRRPVRPGLEAFEQRLEVLLQLDRVLGCCLPVNASGPTLPGTAIGLA